MPRGRTLLPAQLSASTAEGRWNLNHVARLSRSAWPPRCCRTCASAGRG